MNFPSFPFPNRYRISFVFITTYFFDIHVRYFFDNHLKKNGTSNKIIRFSTFNQERSLSILLVVIMKTQSNDKILVKVQSDWKRNLSAEKSKSKDEDTKESSGGRVGPVLARRGWRLGRDLGVRDHHPQKMLLSREIGYLA